ncbi:MAG: prepilin-type N-terminal cleavage/methylation domain-containing protein [Planctomycetota bacterium]
MATRRARSGFTLIELLVVISIIALLIGILLPTLGTARRSAQSVVALAKLRDLGSAAAAYAGEHREQLAITSHSRRIDIVNGRSDWVDGQSWFHAYWPYFSAGGGGVFDPFDMPTDRAWAEVVNTHYRSPLDPSEPVEVGEFRPDLTPRLSFGQNVYYELSPGELVPGKPVDRTKRPFRRVYAVPSPAMTLLYASLGADESGELDGAALTSDHHMAHFWKNSDDMEPDRLALGRHGAGEGYVFLDGHVRVMRYEDTLDADRRVDLWDPEGF